MTVRQNYLIQIKWVGLEILKAKRTFLCIQIYSNKLYYYTHFLLRVILICSLFDQQGIT